MDREALQKRVTDLQSELNSLRAQIDTMQGRSKDLVKQNKELRDQVEQLTRSNEELLDLQKQKDDLFSLVIHDIKNPAGLIKSLVQLLTSYDLKANEQQDIIQDIAATSNKIISLSQEVSRIMALEGSTLELDIEKVNINDIAREIVRLNQANAEKKMIKLYGEYEDNLPDSEIDPQKFSEILDNLISNGIKFTQQGGKVRLKTFKEGNKIFTEVSDNGPGMSEEDIRRAFKKGSKLTARPTAGESSTGLGLWIIKKLVEAHYGRIWIKSALGKGSTFKFSTPLEHINPEH